MAQQPLLSLCMIIKDEARWLPMSLGSARPWVDEIVVVDTGSGDASVEIAQKFGAVVHHRPWQADFALHRNQSLELATGRWLLVLDADEELDQAEARGLRPLLEGLGDPLLMVRIKHLDAAGAASWQLTPRLLRASAGLRFQGRIHEQPGEGGKARAVPLTLIHHGFAQGPEVAAQKARRNLAIIEAWLADEPGDFSALCYRAQSLLAGAGTPAQTEAAARRALEAGLAAAVPMPWLSRAYHPLLVALTMQGRPEDVIAAANQALVHLPQYPDPLYSLSWAFSRLGRWSSVCRQCRRFVDLQEHWRRNYGQYPYAHNLSAGLYPEVLHRWVLAAAELGRDAEALDAFGGLLGQDRGEAFALDILRRLEAAGRGGMAGAMRAAGAGSRPGWAWAGRGASR